MAAFSNYLENKIIDHILRGQVYTPPATVYVALFTAGPNDAGGGTEVSGGSYARVAVATSLAKWAGTQGAGTTAASNGTSGNTSNNDVILFPTPTLSWGVVTHQGIFDAPTGGNLLILGALNVPKTIDPDDTVQINPGTLSLTIDN